jgi:hypothetical protein
MGFTAEFCLSVACVIPLKAENWSTLRRVLANASLQAALGGKAVLYPNRCISGASASVTELDSAASTAAVAESAAAGGAEQAAAHSDSEDSEQDLELDLRVTVFGTDEYRNLTGTELDEGDVNVKMFNFFRTLPGFDTDDDAPLAAAEHAAALTEFERRFNRKEKATALLFQIPLLDQMISAKCENFGSVEHMSVCALGEQMTSAARLLASFGLARDEIHVRSNMTCG